METLQIPGEKEIKQWVRDALKESLEELAILQTAVLKRDEPLISREGGARGGGGGGGTHNRLDEKRTPIS